MYVVSVVLPEVQRDFGVSRADASLPYTLMMLGFGAGGLAMGKLADRWGVHVALWIGAMGMPAALKKVSHRVDHSLAVISLCQRLSTGVAHFLSTVRGGDGPPA